MINVKHAALCLTWQKFMPAKKTNKRELSHRERLASEDLGGNEPRPFLEASEKTYFMLT